jgi:MFS family permease
VNVNLLRLRRRPGVDADHEHYKWWALSCTSLGMLLATVNSGTLIIALPDLERSLGTSLLELVWVILAYMFASTVLVLTAGRLSDLLVSSPLAGLWADRRGSRGLAAWGMLVTAAGLAMMMTLQPDTPYWQSGLWLLIVGIGSGLFNSPNTAAMMGAVPAFRRGVAAGARTMLQNTGAVVSIAFVMAIVTAAIPKDVLFKIFSGIASGLSDAQLQPFIHNMHTALLVLAIVSLVGAGVSLLRPRTEPALRPQEAAA